MNRTSQWHNIMCVFLKLSLSLKNTHNVLLLKMKWLFKHDFSLKVLFSFVRFHLNLLAWDMVVIGKKLFYRQMNFSIPYWFCNSSDYRLRILNWQYLCGYIKVFKIDLPFEIMSYCESAPDTIHKTRKVTKYTKNIDG